MGFPRIQTILNNAINNWRNDPNNGQPPNLDKHNTPGRPPFGWATKAQLLNTTAFGLPLIQTNMIGATPKMGAQTNLVMVFRTGVKLGATTVRMPDGAPPAPAPNPYISDADIQAIEDWIDAGCPD